MVADTFKFVLIAIEVILIFNLMILVHELGHFLAARWRGLVVEKFAIVLPEMFWPLIEPVSPGTLTPLLPAAVEAVCEPWLL